jgi:hypothetical protein
MMIVCVRFTLPDTNGHTLIIQPGECKDRAFHKGIQKGATKVFLIHFSFNSRKPSADVREMLLFSRPRNLD